MMTSIDNTQLVLRHNRLIPIAAYTPADRVAALVAQRGISGDVASVFINDRAERNAIISLARRKRVLV
jgi:hypothetical protein